MTAQLAEIQRKKREEAERVAKEQAGKEHAAARRAAAAFEAVMRGEVAEAFPRDRAAHMSAAFE